MKAKRKYFTIDPPDGIRAFIMPNFSTDVIPHGATLEFVGVKAFSTPHSGHKVKLPFVIFHCLEKNRDFRLPYPQVKAMVDNGTLKE